MQTTQVQLKVSLSERLNDLLVGKAQRLGIPLTQYVKHIIIKEVEKEEFPTYKMSEKTEKALMNALKEHKKGKTKTVNNLSTFFERV